MPFNKQTFLKEFKEKINDDHLLGALKIAITAIIAFVLFSKSLGSSGTFAMVLGAAMCAPIDISSSLKDKVKSISLAAVLVPLVTIIITLSFGHHLYFYIVFGLLVFTIALLSLYGQRANQLSFALLLTMAIAFKNSDAPTNAYSSGLFMFCGGVLYLIVSTLFYLIKPTKFLNSQVANCVDKVASYLEVRSQLWTHHPNVDQIKEQQLAIQVQINDAFQKTNQYLDFTKLRLVNTRSNQRTILAISFLNDMMTLAISTTFDRKSVILQLENEDKANIFDSISRINKTFSQVLQQLSDCIKFNSIYQDDNTLPEEIANFTTIVQKQANLDEQSKAYLQSILQYVNTQYEKIQSLIHLYSKDFNIADFSSELAGTDSQYKPQEYRFKTLLDNLNFKSIYFRYAIRITAAMILGYILGSFIALQREYWVLLTIVVIMRPGYGLTKERMNNRVLGTLIGAIISILALNYITNHYILGAIVFVAIILGYWYTSIDYKIGVTFITIYILLVTGMLSTDADVNVYYRVMNTLTGAAIAFFCSNFLWPSWEASAINKNLLNALSTTLTYLQDFQNDITSTKRDSGVMKKQSKEAYIAIGNLMASYQRLIQEPKRKQKNKNEIFDIALLNQTLIGAITTLDIYLKTNNKSLHDSTMVLAQAITHIQNSMTHIQQLDQKKKKEHATAPHAAIPTTVDTTQQATSPAKDDTTQIAENQLTWINSLSYKIENAAQKLV